MIMGGGRDSKWSVEFCPEFSDEFDGYAMEIQDEILISARLLAELGPTLGRPHADRLNGSRYSNMKELRVTRTWRVAFAFDPDRKAILLVAGDKKGRNQKRFYEALIRKADARMDRHLDQERG